MVIGKDDVIDLLLVGLLANGHILIEDVPGVGKTLLAKALAKSIDGSFSRIQFTPDLTPTDIMGFNIFNRQTNEFVLKTGPVVANILLADEINRAVPRTQSSLLEAMEEGQVTIDGESVELPKPFLVLATQNPIEQEGTFPLPEAQLDRFLMKISMGYPNEADEKEILLSHGRANPLSFLQPVSSIKNIALWQEMTSDVKVSPSLQTYIIKLIRATREDESVMLGASPRAALALQKASQALALLNKRNYVIPDDIKCLCQPVLAHRLMLNQEERLRGVSSHDVLYRILKLLPVPIAKGE